MRYTTEPRPIITLIHGLRLELTPPYQRERVWNTKRQILFIQSILKGYPVPNIFLHERQDERGTYYEAVDGLQRITSIEHYKMGVDYDSFGNRVYDQWLKLSDGRTYNDLHEAERVNFDNYLMQCVIIREAKPAEIYEYFKLLQNGIKLNDQEIRNASIGYLRDVVRDTANSHPFFLENIIEKRERFSHHRLYAQMVHYCKYPDRQTKTDDLYRLYEESTTESENLNNAIELTDRILDVMHSVFGAEKHRYLQKNHVMSLFFMFHQLLSIDAVLPERARIRDWFTQFIDELSALKALIQDRQVQDVDPTLFQYLTHSSQSTDQFSSMRARRDAMLERFTLSFGNQTRDPQRCFTDEQATLIANRDGWKCQLCHINLAGGERGTSWHIDHIQRWIDGGLTTIENGRLTCVTCNTSDQDQHHPL